MISTDPFSGFLLLPNSADVDMGGIVILRFATHKWIAHHPIQVEVRRGSR